MVKAFAALGWKSENFTKGGISALIPQKRKDDCGYGKVDIFLSGDGCIVYVGQSANDDGGDVGQEDGISEYAVF